MNLQRLEYFMAVAREKSLSKAAHALFVSQPALSKQMKKLEDMLGFPLFIRSASGMTLTNKGKELQEELDPILGQLHLIMEKYTTTNVVRMGSDPFLASYFFPDYIEGIDPFQIHLTMIRDDTIDLLPLLEKGDIDAAIIQDHPEHKGCFSTHLFTDEFYAAVPVTHPLAIRETIEIQDCFPYTQLLPDATTPLSKKIRSLMAQHEVTPPAIKELPYHALIGYVAQNRGVSYLPSIMVEKVDYKGVAFIPLKGTPLKREMYLFTLDQRTLDVLKEGFHK
ncbi:LysR family transcriptional regulator [Rossellomorea aquimaris]|uniref:LysR family transcriptional regulator n=1 Tax=Rossellomorea aquimaris TaxID=189382 RepID=UPI0005C9B4AB|nr:LysR family transcriptional regulator [Rossellomorea aquimaris]